MASIPPISSSSVQVKFSESKEKKTRRFSTNTLGPAAAKALTAAAYKSPDSPRPTPVKTVFVAAKGFSKDGSQSPPPHK
jgi:hypothetical protein